MLMSRMFRGYGIAFFPCSAKYGTYTSLDLQANLAPLRIICYSRGPLMTKNVHSYAHSHPVGTVVLVQLASRLSASLSHALSAAGDDWLDTTS